MVSAAPGNQIASDLCANGNKTVNVPSGDYRLEMFNDPAFSSWGTYSFAAFFVPDPQTFALPLNGSAVSNGVPAAGAGNLETKASKDLYTFTIPDGGKQLSLTWRACTSNNANFFIPGLKWRIVSATTGSQIAGDMCYNGNKTVSLPAGDFRLEVSTDPSSWGTYSFAATLG